MTPFQEGFTAYATRSICPYPSWSPEAEQWRTGWWAAASHTERVLDALLQDRVDRQLQRAED
jgi:hypothetical protein